MKLTVEQKLELLKHNKEFFEDMHKPEGVKYQNMFGNYHKSSLALLDIMSMHINDREYDLAVIYGELANDLGIFHDDKEDISLVGEEISQHLMVLSILCKHLGMAKVNEILTKEKQKEEEFGYFNKKVEFYKETGL